MLVLLVLSLQLLGMTRHDHDYLDTKADCASCFLIHQLPTDLPPPTLQVVPVETLVSYPLLTVAAPSYSTYVHYLLPRAQGPPAASLL